MTILSFSSVPAPRRATRPTRETPESESPGEGSHPEGAWRAWTHVLDGLLSALGPSDFVASDPDTSAYISLRRTATPGPGVRQLPHGLGAAAHLPRATGVARAARDRGEAGLVVGLLDARSALDPGFQDALAFAAVWRAPILFLAASTGAPGRVARLGQGHGVPGQTMSPADEKDAAALLRPVLEAVKSSGPALVELSSAI